MTDVVVRAAQPADREAIRAITLAAYAEYAEQMPADHWEAYRLSILLTLEQVAPAEQMVAARRGALLGTVLLYPPLPPDPGQAVSALPWPEVRLLAVAPASRGTGVGAVLMDECVRRAKRSGAPALSLHTTDMMRTAQRMYVRMGFVRAPSLDFQPLPGVTVLGYRLDLV